MNLVDKYIEVIKAKKGLRYDKDVLVDLNQTLGTDYFKQTLYNWRSSNNPRPVPPDVKAHMRETVVIDMLNHLNTDLKTEQSRKLIRVLNDERKMRQQILDAALEELGVTVSSRARKTIAESLETLYDLQE